MAIGWLLDGKENLTRERSQGQVARHRKDHDQRRCHRSGAYLLVQEGFYSNRTDLIRTAIRNQLATHAEVLRQTVARRTLVLGLQDYSKRDLEAVRKSGTKLRIQALGLVRIAEDVSPALARDTIESIAVLGALQASAAVKAALNDRIH